MHGADPNASCIFKRRHENRWNILVNHKNVSSNHIEEDHSFTKFKTTHTKRFELFKLMLKFVILWWWRVYFHVRFRSNAAEQIHRNKNESDKIIFEWHKHYAGSDHLWMWSREWARNSGKMMKKQSKHKTGYWLKSFHCYNQRESWANNQRNSIICSEKLVLTEQMFHSFFPSLWNKHEATKVHQKVARQLFSKNACSWTPIEGFILYFIFLHLFLALCNCRNVNLAGSHNVNNC